MLDIFFDNIFLDSFCLLPCAVTAKTIFLIYNNLSIHPKKQLGDVILRKTGS